jgi:hypothetical protein
VVRMVAQQRINMESGVDDQITSLCTLWLTLPKRSDSWLCAAIQSLVKRVGCGAKWRNVSQPQRRRSPTAC